MKISRGLFPDQTIRERRSEEVRRRVRESLARPDARPLTVGVFQMANHCGGEAGKARNLDRMVAAVAAGKAEDVQVLAFPELCLPGHFTGFSGSVDAAQAMNRALADEPGRSRSLARLQEAAADARVALVFGFAELEGENCYNAAGVIDADGRWVGTRRKNPLSPNPHERASFCEPPPSERSAVFATTRGVLGVAVCFDGEFPESIRRMRLDGAELLVWCNAATGDAQIGHSHRLNDSGSYAQANCLWVACCNACGGDAYGTSSIYSPWGEPLVVLSVGEEEMGIAQINLALIPEWSRWRDRLYPVPPPAGPDAGRGGGASGR